MADFIGATPRNRILGALADAVQGVSDFAGKPFGYDNPPGKALSGLLGLPSVANTVNQLSYGGALGTGSGMTWKPKEDTMDAAMIAAPMVKPMGILAKKSAEFAAPKAAQMAENYLVNTGGILPATVWHGSPHKFDKFDASKIGTGEGAQAYGHGLYLAESPDVAKQYQKELATNVNVNGKPFYDGKGKQLSSTGNQDVDDYILANHGDIDAAIKNAIDYEDNNVLPLLQALKQKGAVSANNTGSLYKVDLPDEHIAKMLDWDKPLSQQSQYVKDALASSEVKYGPLRQNRRIADIEYNGPTTGGSIHNDIAHRLVPEGQSDLWRGSTPLGNQGALAAEHLRQLGIPGIRYLDGGSRGTGAGTSNYVIFPGNEDMLTILERNGQPNQFLGIK